MLYGLLNLSWWQYTIVTILLTHLTVVSITLYLHRCQAHRALDLHPIVSHFFRFWLWLTTGMITKVWVGIHRKHHAFSDKPGDPHSPKLFGIKKVFLGGAELYKAEARNVETIERFSQGTPNDWLERNLYQKFSYLGITLLFIVDIVLFGIPGLIVWPIQMLTTPLLAAGVINGLGHYIGYRNFECADEARNVIPFAVLMGGEELHNNHHSFGSSAKLSVKWWEFDIGWYYIKLLSWCKLAKVRKTPPKIKVNPKQQSVDLETLKTIINNRIQVFSRYGKEVIIPVLKQEKRKAGMASQNLLHRAKKLLIRESTLLDNKNIQRIKEMLDKHETLKLVYNYRQKLQDIWNKTTANHKELIEAVQEWCKQAEKTGVEVLQQFAGRLKGYTTIC